MLTQKLMRFSVAAVVLVAGSPLFGASYDALTGYNSSSNLITNMWQYGTSVSAGGAFTPFLLNNSSGSPSYNYWSNTGTFAGPTIADNTSGSTITIGTAPAIIWPNTALLIGPGSPGTGTSNFATVRFVAPSTGNFNITGFFSDLQQSSVRLYVEVGGAQDFSNSFAGSSPQQGTIPFSLSGIALTTGETVDFTVDSEGNQSDDVVGFDGTIQTAAASSAPEPSAIWLLALGLLALPVVRRSMRNPHLTH